MLNVFICNGPSLAGGMRPCPDASFTSGLLHVAIAGALSLPATLVPHDSYDVILYGIDDDGEWKELKEDYLLNVQRP